MQIAKCKLQSDARSARDEPASLTPLYVSFFTPAYAAEAKGLEQSLQEFDLPFVIAALSESGDTEGRWQRNCRRKAAFVRRMLEVGGGRPIVWLDADARVRCRPRLFDAGAQLAARCDFAAHFKDDRELLSGTLFFSGSEASLTLARRWEQECTRAPEAFDQHSLARAVDELQAQGEIAVEPLPAPYTLIFDLMAHQGPPVIEHLQASRRLKT